MIGAIAGDMIGSEYEFHNISNEDFGPLFSKKSTYTDDTVLTIATADSILNNTSYSNSYLKYARKYENRGYGGNFDAMIKKGKLEPYNSYGNGSAMRVSPVGWMYDTTMKEGLAETFLSATQSAECSHNHPEGIKGATAIAAAIYMARKSAGYMARSGVTKEGIKEAKEEIKKAVEEIGYDLSSKVSDFRQGKFDVTCQGTIPRCMAIFAESDSFESAIRKGVALGGDVDTNCSIVGGICEAFYGVPNKVVGEVYLRLPRPMADIVTIFTKKHINTYFEEPDVKVGSLTATFEDQLSSLFSSGPIPPRMF